MGHFGPQRAPKEPPQSPIGLIWHTMGTQRGPQGPPKGSFWEPHDHGAPGGLHLAPILAPLRPKRTQIAPKNDSRGPPKRHRQKTEQSKGSRHWAHQTRCRWTTGANPRSIGTVPALSLAVQGLVKNPEGQVKLVGLILGHNGAH